MTDSVMLEAEGPGGARMFACVDPGAARVSPALGTVRIAAHAHPFPDEAAAKAAIEAAGGKLVKGGGR